MSNDVSDEAAVRKEIERINGEWSEAFRRGDYEGVAALYTEEALFLPPEQPVARGRAGVRDTVARVAQAGVTDLLFETITVEDHGEVVLEMARSTSYAGSEALRQNYYTIVWKRQSDGALQLHWDIVSSSTD